jgi:hypothetical protein
MALLLHLFKDSDPQDILIQVRKRKQLDLPEYILGHVEWIATTEPGYYICDEGLNKFEPVEFIDNNW